MFFKLYGANITPACCVCERSENKNGSLTCPIVGKVEENGKCRRFRYDPLKREPRIPRELERFDNKDFSLNEEENEDEA